MVNYMEELSVTEAENLKKTISALFRQTCILQVKYDPVTLTLTGEGVAVERLNVTATKIILLIKIIYRDKILGEGLNATVTNLAEIREYGKNTNLINEKLTMAEWKDALYVMSKHQIIEVPGAIQNVEDQTKIYIYSTINLYCSGVDIQALIKEYVDEEGGAEVEAGEEDIYKNADE